jgi:transposase
MNQSTPNETKNGSKNTVTEPRTTPAAKTSSPTKRYDEEFKKQAVENWIKTGKAGTQIAAELGISYPSLKDWKARYHGGALPERDTLAAENRALKRELARVREQRDILKKTLGIFTEPPLSATKPSNA